MSGKKYDDSWDSMLADLSGYLGGIFGKVRAWLDAEDTPDDAEFDDSWYDWVRLEDADYEEAEDEEEAYEVEEYPALVEIRDTDMWRHRARDR